MAHDEEQLAPETIEEQLDHLAHTLQFMPPNASKTADMQVVEALQGAYEDERQVDAGSLDRVWNRLAPRTLQQQQATPVRRLPDTRERRSRMRNIFSPQRESIIASRLGMIASVTLLVILVGSLSVGVALFAAHQKVGTLVSTATAIPAPTQTPIPQPVLLQTIHMLDETNGWAITDQHQIIRTNDGGVHWRDVTPPGLGSEQIVADFLSASFAWVSSTVISSSGIANASATLFRTSDGGHTWSKTTFQGFNLGQIDFINSQDGWFFGETGVALGSSGAVIYRTTDGGATWTNVATAGPNTNPNDPNALPFSGDKTGISFLNALTGWATGTEGAPGVVWLYVTHDGGVTWHHQSLPLPAGEAAGMVAPYVPTFFDSQNGSMLVDFEHSGLNPGAYYLYVTHDGGASWQLMPPLPVNEINLGHTSPPDFINANQGWLSDGAALFMTSDGGQHWTRLQTNSTFKYVMELNVVSRTVGWAISFPPTSISAESTLNNASRAMSRPTSPDYSGTLTLLKTVDGGQTWETVPTSIV